MITADKALRGRVAKMPVAPRHAIHGTPMEEPFPGMEIATFGMGCFWGAEKGFWLLPGVHSTAVGYAGGFTPNASYEEVCSGQTGHTEVVRVVFDPKVTSYDAMLKAFWEGHDPTQGCGRAAMSARSIVPRFTTTPTSSGKRRSSRATCISSG